MWFESTPRHSPDYTFRKIEDEGILLPLRASMETHNRIFSLNPLGVAIWQKIDGKKTGKEIQSELEKEFDVVPAQLNKDLDSFFSHLTQIGSITFGEKP